MSVMLKVSSTVREQWIDHRGQWSQCNKCKLCKDAYKHVLVRGILPCEVLFVGEAPGKDENLNGYPFVGRSGKLLDSIIREAVSIYGPYSYAITNTVACLPLDADGKIRPPVEQETGACEPRLAQLIKLARPEKIICIGAIASSHVQDYDIPKFSIVHPAWLLRQGGSKSKSYKETIRNLVAILRV